MKKLMFLIVAAIAFASCGTISTKSPVFKSIDNAPDSTCLVYVYRVKNFVGGVAPFEIRTAVYDKKTNDFAELPGVIKLYQMGYTPFTLKANTLYRLTIGTNAHTLFYLGPKQSVTVVKINGPKMETEAYKETSFYMSHSVKFVTGFFNNLYGPLGALMMLKSQKNLGEVEKKALMDAGFKELTPNPDSPLYRELKNMRLSNETKKGK